MKWDVFSQLNLCVKIVISAVSKKYNVFVVILLYTARIVTKVKLDVIVVNKYTRKE